MLHRQASSIVKKKKREIRKAQSGLSQTIHEQGRRRRRRRKSITTEALTMLMMANVSPPHV